MRRNGLGWLGAAAVIGIGLAAWPVDAHHSIAATYDETKSARLQGVVSKFEWNNPHVYIYLDVRGSGGATTPWEAEFGSIPDLKRVGWSGDLVKVGDTITVEGIRARDGQNRVSGKTLTAADSKRYNEAPAERKLAPVSKGKAKATPRWPDGHIRLGPEPGQRGYWADPSSGGLYETSAGAIRMNHEGLLANIADAAKVAPFQPWAKALYEYRQRNKFADDPSAFCLAPGGTRQFQDRYGVQLFEQVERKRVFVMSAGGNRNWRIIDMDGRANPKPEDVTPTFYGYSTGRWENPDTLVMVSTAFVERFWFSNGGLPHTEALELTERITRPDYNTLRYDVTVNDPNTYTRPWTGGFNLTWVPDADIDEYFCDDNNKETEHLSGKHETP